MSGWKARIDRLLGRGAAAVTVPTLDGPLLPNQLLEQAAPVVAVPEIDNLLRVGPHVLFTSGNALYALDPAQNGAGAPLRTFEGAITALAATGDVLAIASEGTGIVISGGAFDGRTIADLDGESLACVTALLWQGAGTLVVALGAGSGRKTRDWRRDLMEQGCSGSLWRIDLGPGTSTCLARNLAWPAGLARTSDGSIVVSEAWRHRILSIGTAKPQAPAVLIADLAAYPGRIVAAQGGGYWLAMPTVRNQLVEFILREPGYLKRMLAEIPEAHWMAPTLVSGISFKEPMQGSQLKQMGIQKPWSATRSYGLVVRCDARLQPLRSYHSRADGHVHGVTSLCEWGDDLLVGAKGAGEIVRLVQGGAGLLQEAAQ